MNQKYNPRKIQLTALVFAGLGGLLFGCSPDSLGLDTDQLISSAAPAGSNSVLISDTIPATLVAGENTFATVTYQNTGTASPDNDWNSNYILISKSGSGVRWPNRPLDVTVTADPSETHTFHVFLRAPTSAGTYTINYQMYSRSPNAGFFGDPGSASIVVSDSGTRNWDCAYSSDTLPTTLAPGEQTTIDIEVTNTGLQTWTSGEVCLYSQDDPRNTWGGDTCVYNTSDVAQGENYTYSLDITAPTNVGTYTLDRQLFQRTTDANGGGVGIFNSAPNCVSLSAQVVGTPEYDSVLDTASSTVDDIVSVTPSESFAVTATFENTGTQTWTSADKIRLFSVNSPNTLWGSRINFGPISSDVAPGETASFTFNVIAPSVEDNYTSAWQLYNGATQQFFGEETNISVNVSSSNSTQYDATLISQNIPSTATQRTTATFEIVMENSGLQAWSGSDFRLRSVNTPDNLWTQTFSALGASEIVLPGEQKTFIFTVTSPVTPGLYDSLWQMDWHTSAGGIGYFGDIATSSVDVVTVCGNGIFNGGEECDDGNSNDSDACSNSCVINPSSITLNPTTPAGKTFYSRIPRNLSKVAIGDINGDSIDDLIIGGELTARVAGERARVSAGTVYGYYGSSSFFDNNFTDAAASPDFTIIGARPYDRLAGLTEGSILTGDVTGDNIDDIIVSAYGAACADGTGNCGRVYVIQGTSLSSTPYNLSVSLDSPVVATLVAPTNGDRTVVAAVGDVTGDNISDILVGMPYADPGGVENAGTIAIVQGGTTLTGTITLSSGNVLALIHGAGAGDRIGYRASVGSLDASGNNDILVSSPGFDSSTGGADAGGIWALFAPFSADRTLSSGSDYNGRWRGNGIRDYLGSAITVADLIGTSEPDIVFGVPGYVFSSARYGAVNIINGPITDGTDFDFNVSDVVNNRVFARDEGDFTGWCMSTGDINGDGQLDLLAGSARAQGSSNTLLQAGEIAIEIGRSISASNQLSASTPLTVYLDQQRPFSCQQIGQIATGDLDNDGTDDFCFGSSAGHAVVGSITFRGGRVDCVQSPY